MKNIAVILFSISLILSSCSSDKVVTSSWIQKRKYTKGFYFSGFGQEHDSRSLNQVHVVQSVVNQNYVPVSEQNIPKIQEQKKVIQRTEDFLCFAQTETVKSASTTPSLISKDKYPIIRDQQINNGARFSEPHHLSSFPQPGGMGYMMVAAISLFFTLLIFSIYFLFLYGILYGDL
jgi:hypothetical protein